MLTAASRRGEKGQHDGRDTQERQGKGDILDVYTAFEGDHAESKVCLATAVIPAGQLFPVLTSSTFHGCYLFLICSRCTIVHGSRYIEIDRKIWCRDLVLMVSESPPPDFEYL